MMLLFVYGTLMKSGSNHHWLRRARLIGPAQTAASFELWDLGDYPAMVAGGCTSVSGELYEADVELLPALDAYEGHPDLFRRQEIRLQQRWNDISVISYLYVSNLPGTAQRVQTGRWGMSVGTGVS